RRHRDTIRPSHCLVDFITNDTSTTTLYTLSLHDALPIYKRAHIERADYETKRIARLQVLLKAALEREVKGFETVKRRNAQLINRSEEHTSELQSRENLVCRLLLEKKKIQDAKRVISAVVI